jgi:hypothetical protein
MRSASSPTAPTTARRWAAARQHGGARGAPRPAPSAGVRGAGARGTCRLLGRAPHALPADTLPIPAPRSAPRTLSSCRLAAPALRRTTATRCSRPSTGTSAPAAARPTGAASTRAPSPPLASPSTTRPRLAGPCSCSPSLTLSLPAPSCIPLSPSLCHAPSTSHRAQFDHTHPTRPPSCATLAGARRRAPACPPPPRAALQHQPSAPCCPLPPRAAPRCAPSRRRAPAAK